MGTEAQVRTLGESADRSGRERELAQAEAVLSRGDARLVTFTGPAGVGKTWTARELKRRLVTGRGWPAVTVRTDCAQGFTELLSTVAEALGMPASGGALQDRLTVALADGSHLLLLDGCEALLGHPHPIGRLLELAPDVRIVATSLRPLQVPGEHVVGLDPFEVPPAAASPEALRDSAAVRLFCRTAARASHRFEDQEADVTAIAELCRRAHGLPLAIEIMASRVAEQPPRAMVEDLDSGHEFTFQHTRASDAPRHLSLRSALRWSYSMLDPTAALLLRRMSVFAAPATYDMLAIVVPDDHAKSTLLDDVSALVDHRLASAHPGSGEPAFSLVDLVREFAAEQLVEEGEHADAEEARTRAVVEFAVSRAAAEEVAEDDVAHLELARAEPDLRSTLRRLLGSGEVEQGLRLAVALSPFVLRRGYDGFVRSSLGSLLRRARAGTVDDALVARALLWQARLTAHFDGPDAADEVRVSLAQGVERARASSDKDALLLGLAFVMQALPTTGDVAAAAAAAAEGVPLAEASGDERWMARFYAWAGMVAHQAGRLEESLELAWRCVERVESNHDPRAQILALLLLAGQPEGRTAALMRRLPSVDDLLVTARRLDDARYEPFLLRAAAGLALREGDLRRAALRCGECLRLAHRQATWHVLPFAVLLLGLVAAADGDLEQAARCHGMVRSRLDLLRPATPPDWFDRYLAVLEQVRVRLGEEAFETHAAQGEQDMHANALGQLIGYADRVSGHTAPVIPVQRNHGPDHLTRRELEVLEELITGATNKEISHRLGMSPKTVMHHSGSIYRKLGVRGRAEATAWAFRHGLAD